jgi:hypothetical protein
MYVNRPKREEYIFHGFSMIIRVVHAERLHATRMDSVEIDIRVVHVLGTL